jgi:hypothetical protein
MELERTCPVCRTASFSVDTRNGDILWELWIEGFEKAVALRPAAWKTLLNADVDTAAAMSGMLMLADIIRGEKEVKDRDMLQTAAPDKIADWVVTLNEWRLANHPTMQGIDPKAAASPRKKVGRNEPCPCGSGRNTRSAAASTNRYRGWFVGWLPPVAMGCGARPQPRSSRMPVADKRHKFINHQHGSALVYQTP